MTEVIALALGIALSPFPVVPAILLLFTERPRPTSLAFLATWWVGIAVPTATATAFAEAVNPTGASPTWLSWLRIVAGIALVAYGATKWRGRGAADDQPAWMRSLQDSTPRRAATLALLLSVANPKVVLLAVAAGLEIGSSGLTAAGDAVAVLGFTVLATMSVTVPVLAYALMGERVLPPLARAKDWLMTHNAAVMAVVLFLIGLVLITNGLTKP
jgi:threonine/homoserine/homoserine lactone efflux protein